MARRVPGMKRENEQVKVEMTPDELFAKLGAGAPRALPTLSRKIIFNYNVAFGPVDQFAPDAGVRQNAGTPDEVEPPALCITWDEGGSQERLVLVLEPPVLAWLQETFAKGKGVIVAPAAALDHLKNGG